MKKTLNVLLLLLVFQISAQNSDSKKPNLNAANSLLKEKINKHAPDLDKYYQLCSNLNGKTKKEIEIDFQSRQLQFEKKRVEVCVCGGGERVACV